MHFLIIDTRFQSPVHVFLERAPWDEPAFPGLVVRRVTLAPAGPGEREQGTGFAPAVAVGQDPYRADEFREFASDKAARLAGFRLIEPRFVGPTWTAYHRAFGYGERKLAGTVVRHSAARGRLAPT